MKKLLAAAIVFASVLALSGCEGQWSQFFMVQKQPEQTATPTPTQERTENLMKTNIKGENEMNPIVTIEMENGMTINLELYPDKAPNTVNNFISLVKKGFYDGLTFHRIIDGFMIQGGCPDGTGMGGPGYQIPGEFSNNGFQGNDVAHKAGVISMARSRMMDSAGSQFFIMVGTARHLDGEYAAFGKTVDEESLKNCLKLAEAKVSGDRPVDPPVIKSIKVDTKGVDYEEPNHS
jgi:peptidyl-prolyl cis-trans isomerase B (cyclophilin B)